MAAVKNITDESKLIQIAKTSANNDVRCEAIQKISVGSEYESELIKIAKSSSINWLVRFYAVYKLTDIDALKYIAEHDNYEQIKTEYGTQDDQYKVSKGYPVRRAAYDRLSTLLNEK